MGPRTQAHQRGGERKPHALFASEGQDRVAYVSVKSHTRSAENLTERGLPALAFLEYQAVGLWGPIE